MLLIVEGVMMEIISINSSVVNGMNYKRNKTYFKTFALEPVSQQ